MTRDGIPELMDSCESAASMIGALLDVLTKWNMDELSECVQLMEDARGAARAAAGRLHDQLPRERPYTSSQAL